MKDAQTQFGYQISGGRFMKIFLLIVGWAIILGTLMSLIMCMVMACCDPRDKGERINNKAQFAGYNSHHAQEDYTVDQDGEEGEESEEEQEQLRGEAQQYRMVGRAQ